MITLYFLLHEFSYMYHYKLSGKVIKPFVENNTSMDQCHRSFSREATEINQSR